MIDLPALYAILRAVARDREIVGYLELSRLYHEQTGEWHDPHGSWDQPLAEINRHATAAKLPALSAVVTYTPADGQPFGPPGDGFWESPGAPRRPRGADDRFLVWTGVVNRVHQAAWPEVLPGIG